MKMKNIQYHFKIVRKYVRVRSIILRTKTLYNIRAFLSVRKYVRYFLYLFIKKFMYIYIGKIAEIYIFESVLKKDLTYLRTYKKSSIYIEKKYVALKIYLTRLAMYLTYLNKRRL